MTWAVALVWGTCELWLWGARPQSLAFIGAMIAGSSGVELAAKVRDVLR